MWTRITPNTDTFHAVLHVIVSHVIAQKMGFSINDYFIFCAVCDSVKKFFVFPDGRRDVGKAEVYLGPYLSMTERFYKKNAMYFLYFCNKLYHRFLGGS